MDFYFNNEEKNFNQISQNSISKHKPLFKNVYPNFLFQSTSTHIQLLPFHPKNLNYYLSKSYQ